MKTPYKHVESNGALVAIVTNEEGPNEGDNYTVLLWDSGVAYKCHSWHIANATAIANDWVHDSHGGVYLRGIV